MKKHIKAVAGVLAIAVVFSGGVAVGRENISITAPITASAEENYTYENLKYKFSEDGTIEITNCDHEATEVVIPSEIDGVPVTSIGYSAFYLCDSLESIEIPNSVISIKDYAFHGIPWLEKKKKENPLVIINGILIDGTECSGDIIIPDGVTSIMCNAFSNNSNITSIIIPDSVTDLGESVFSECTSLKYAKLGNGITKMQGYGYTGPSGVFYGCKSLETVILPDNIEYIGENAFCYCESLTNIDFPETISHIGLRAFSGTAWLENQDDGLVFINNIVYEYKGEMPENTEIVLPENTTGISAWAFMGCKNLSAIKLNNGLKYIERRAFSGCINLKSLIIPNSVTVFENGIVTGCASLKELKLSENTPYLSCDFLNGDFVGGVANCISLESLVIPLSVKKIDRFSLGDNPNLKVLIILNPDCEIMEHAFSGVYVGSSDSNPIIYGYTNSTAQEYAENYNYQFVSLGESPEKEITVTGDINSDGEFNVSDVVLLQKYILGDETMEISDWKQADFTGDGVLDVFDLCLMKKKLIENK